ncbi:hypothetical protein EMIHUDRAFT_454529 [Emiliania huxleyi CCMP1516]|uniref:Magnesium transporter NIPA2 n=2 Tax=Emiliania huxleyi TaxID=2903 RepID=A0A0D3KSZ0_EMIH1|nr:hypothetical protein EMIHUDRAFT_454529 [Emiliania huxleyi CCMP1516]EOD38875.1 hypothetical protein EMIHUDRAFT_454529 [Emiliania huxleyi CCMP1516]|eukprot:XP_005791304.1 hypothetical protein EMIHUDRAFT_454529 [Emiliania huxleyi CCMP1516]
MPPSRAGVVAPALPVFSVMALPVLENRTCAVVPPGGANSSSSEPFSEEEAGTSTFMVGVVLSVIADVIIAVSLNVQKTAHMRNEGADGKPVKGMLKLPLWWLGLLLNVGGELGNMLAYGFAPASVVAPVGSVGVVANEVIAVLFLKEPFRWRDAAGLVAIVGGVVLIIVAVPEDPVDLNAVVLQREYYARPAAYGYLIGLWCAVVLFLVHVEPRYAQKSVLVWLLLCSMISSTTVIAARGFSSMLTQAVGGDCAGAHCVGDELFPPCRLTLAHYLFWVLLAIIVTTAIWSAYFLNRAMMIFGNTEVVPVYYCTFTLASIVGGGVVYREFSGMPWQQWLQFLAGVALALGGVLAITSGRGKSARGGGAVLPEPSEQEQPAELPAPEAGGGRRAERLARARAHNQARPCSFPSTACARGAWSEEKAAELRRQSRGSFAAPVGGIGSAHSSFRRDDRIHTDLRALLDETESEIAAGEHIAAAYRLRDAASSRPWNAWDTSDAAVSPAGIAEKRDEKWASGGGGPPAESTEVSSSSEPSSEPRAAAGEPSSEPAGGGTAEAAELKSALAATAEELANAQATIRALEARLSSA